jgi:hypothetical protein
MSSKKFVQSYYQAVSTVRFAVQVEKLFSGNTVTIGCDDLWQALLVMEQYRFREPRLVAQVPQERGETA